VGTPGKASAGQRAVAPVVRYARDATQHCLPTRVLPGSRPRGPDHSFAGVMWDCRTRTHEEVVITSVAVGGMLGRVRIFARDGSWRRDGPARHITPETVGWVLVADEVCAPSWGVCREVRLHTPVHILPHGTAALFVHSNLPDDLGIQYQSYYERDVFGQDARLELFPGLGFTGATPFDERSGWYRAFRGLAGTVSYTASPMRWTLDTHARFPRSMRDAVLNLLAANEVCPASPLFLLPKHVLLHVLECCHWDWFVPEGEEPPPAGSRDGGMRLDAPAGGAVPVYGDSEGEDWEDDEVEEWDEEE